MTKIGNAEKRAASLGPKTLIYHKFGVISQIVALLMVMNWIISIFCSNFHSQLVAWQPHSDDKDSMKFLHP